MNYAFLIFGLQTADLCSWIGYLKCIRNEIASLARPQAGQHNYSATNLVPLMCYT